MPESNKIPRIETTSVGHPITRQGVSFFPLYLHANSLPEIATGAASKLEIKELPDAAVPTLCVYNPGDSAILIVEGEQFEGGLQNRTINATVLIAPKSTLQIPVSCVERGRWGRKREYRRAPTFTPPEVRFRTQETVNQSMCERRSRSGDQEIVWGSVDSVLRDLDTPSQTSAASESTRVFERDHSRAQALKELGSRGALTSQCGIAVAHGHQVKEIQLFGSAHLLAAHWNALIGSHLLSPVHKDGRPTATGVLAVLRRFGTLPPLRAKGVGLGTEHRVEDQWGLGQALTLDGAFVHGSYYTSDPLTIN